MHATRIVQYAVRQISAPILHQKTKRLKDFRPLFGENVHKERVPGINSARIYPIAKREGKG